VEPRTDNGAKIGTVELTDREFDLFRRFIYDKSGISLHDGKKELVRTRLGSRLRKMGLTTYKQYFEFVQADKTEEELVNLLDAISTNLTSFFREINHFHFLEKRVLPEMIVRKEGEREREIRVWSAGCSSGEEPYSIAFTLKSRLPDFSRYDVKILATDLSTQALGKAARGSYTGDQVKTVPPDMRGKYLIKGAGDERGPRFTVTGDIKKMIQFKRFNLMTPRFPFKRKFDFIFCRNVMIYFDKPTQEGLVNKYYDVLAPGGYLLIGHSESLTGVTHPFKYIQPTIYQKIG
jgi:chemotaxis protein methyltransferase CheR